MQRITRSNTVPVDRRYQVRDPVARVRPGETFVVETINFRTPVIRTPEDANPVEYKEREETGPIYVDGFRAGDVLAIHIEDIQPEGHASGAGFDETGRNSFLPIEDESVLFPGGLWAPKHMMVGDIYVTPDGWPGSQPAHNGGNMDFKDICAGNTLYLRALLDGGLLALGDLHAAQGDGELAGLGAECAGEVTLRITNDETYLPVWPMILKQRSFVSICCKRDYAEARDGAIAEAAQILARITGVTEKEAHLYVTTVGDLRNGAIWPMGRTEPVWVRDVVQVVGLEVPLLGKMVT